MTADELQVSTAELLETCRQWIQRYVVVSNEQAVILAAWILHTYVFEAADVTPYIHITAPERECGKSKLIRVLAVLSANPIQSSAITAAALVRCIATKKPTLFLDEMDAQLGGSKEFAETVRGILNSGFEKDGKHLKCHGENHDLREFNTYCPKCFAGIGRLPETVASRSIVIEMRRKTQSETVEPFRERVVREVSGPVRAKLKAWRDSDVSRRLEQIRPAALPGLGDRQNDISEPLLCIAILAGPAWRQKLSNALTTVLSGARSENVSNGVSLLSDIRAVFIERKTDRLPSETLAEDLCKMEGRPWAEWSHGKGLTKNNLARQLEKYRIHPRKIRFGSDTSQGYYRHNFEDPWERYCPIPSISTGTPEQPTSPLTETAISNRNTNGTTAEHGQSSGRVVPDCSVSVPVAKGGSNPHEQRTVPAVPVLADRPASNFSEGLVGFS